MIDSKVRLAVLYLQYPEFIAEYKEALNSIYFKNLEETNTLDLKTIIKSYYSKNGY